MLLINPICFCSHMKIVVAMVMEIFKLLQKHMDPEITQNYSSYLGETWFVKSFQCADYVRHFFTPNTYNT